ncbi:MAG TPA: exodeoxyribonuclease III [Candidatus Latescibacteria bacterium]|nr:exodeoxyribonuclease III [Gemmatimonadota bacterium]HCR18254.1 exodeoxyribonuclease III [Candidatus Latescibacterota bacterium]
MRVTTWNVNGLRAALRKGFKDHITRISPDVLLLQEIRALPAQLPGDWENPKGWHVHWHPAERKGYSGTAVLAKYPIQVLRRGIHRTDPEGRILHVKVKEIQFVCVYLPSGSSSVERQHIKETKWLKKFLPWARKLSLSERPVLMGGDFNIAHTEKDIFYAKGNAKNSGFLPHERRWMTRLLSSGWHDILREQVGDSQGPYSWWSNRGRARELDRGWRIDYLLGNQHAHDRVKSANIDRRAGMTVSDHAPVTVDLE